MTRSRLFLCILLVIASCSPRYYAPNQPNVPLLRAKGEVRFSVLGSEGQDVNSLEFQGAYALTNKLGVMVNTDLANGNDASHGFIMDGGAGYYRPLRRFTFESYGGLGIGKALNQYSSTESSDLGFTKFFLQPNIGVSARFVEAAFATRLTGLHYYRIQTTLAGPTSDLDYIRSHASSFLAEPSFIFRAGPRYAKFQFQLTRSFNLTAPQLLQENAMVGIGVFFSPNR
jgi:hypothetical protein